MSFTIFDCFYFLFGSYFDFYQLKIPIWPNLYVFVLYIYILFLSNECVVPRCILYFHAKLISNTFFAIL